ncbi:MAG: efflux RND transporter periplasmic adaptor subunit [Paramuribaculum sp.]|nr:efflux RND transporter periplasmic adaptor subunit [Paramuribaculum sp.]
MKKIIIPFYYTVILIFSSCGNHSQHTHAESDEHEHEHQHGDEIVLHAEDAEKFGVKTLIIKPDTFFDVLTVSGKVLSIPTQSAAIVAPKAGTISLNTYALLGNKLLKGQSLGSVSTNGIAGGDISASARARITAAKRELDRLTPLLKDGIITKGELNAAQAEYDQAVAAYSPSASNGSAISPITGVITELLVKNGEYVNAGQPIALVSESSEITIQAEVPTTFSHILNNISGANVRPAGSERWIPLSDLGGKIKNNSQIVSNSGYEPVYFTAVNNGNLIPGTFVEVALLGTPRPEVISVPVSAISEQQGAKFVFVKVDDDGYEKVPVVTGTSNGISVEILSGLEPGKEIVCEGTVFVRLAETSGNVPEGHSHNH